MRSWTGSMAPRRSPTPVAPEATGANGAWRAARERGRAWVPLVILLVGLVLLLYSMQLGSVTTSGYDLQRLQGERAEWRQRNEQLQLELAKVQSLAWIEVEAVRRLGMQKAGRVTYLEVAPPTAVADAESTRSAVAERAERRGPDLFGFWRGVLAYISPTVEAGP